MIFGKKFLAILGLLLLVLATSGLAFQVKAQNINAPSFELQYPKLPGLDELVPGQSLVYYVKYFLNLFYV
ncbi:MAG: hypothetical protein NTV62_00725, partial [Candidatus Gribaldobacteria bacterium]|nr:hypothetical protein [Candidatus Gribaldobacteria bacterium]